jgi:hypothetical protein
VPIQTSDLLLKLNPMHAIQAPQGRGGGGDKSMERQKLALMREEFEHLKKNQEEQRVLERLAEGGRMTREQMVSDRSAATAKAAAEATAQETKQGAYSKFTELNGKGDIEGARAMLPYMRSLGMRANLIGEENGLPAYEVDMDAANAAKRDQEVRGALPMPGSEMGTEGVDPMSWSREHGGKPPPAGGFTDPVPDNVIDLRAIQKQTLSRLNPALESLVESYPLEQRESAAATAKGVSGGGLPFKESLEEFHRQRSGPNSLIQADIESKKKDAAPDFNPMQQQQLIHQGQQEVDQKFKGAGIDSGISVMNLVGQIKHVLTNEDRLDDPQIATLILDLSKAKGAQSDKDVARALGLSAASTIDQILAFVEMKLEGGFDDKQINSLIGFAESSYDREEEVLFKWLDGIDKQIANPRMNEFVRQGWETHRDTMIPQDLRDDYEDWKAEQAEARGEKPAPRGGAGEEEATAGAEQDGEFEDEVRVQAAEAGFDADAILRLTGRESGNDARATNSMSGATGIIQFLDDDIAKSVGTTMEDLKGMSRIEQLPYAMEYFRSRGVTEDSPPEDYAMAVAAPGYIGKPEDTVITQYAEGTKEWKQNPGWRPKGGGPITVGSVLAFYGLGSGASQSKAPAKATAPKTTAAKTPEDARLEALINGGE